VDAAPPRYRTVIGAASLIVAPSLMSVGDLMHPHESWDPAAQVAMVAESTSRWYVAHLLLFVGMLVFVPGILALSDVVAKRRPASAYAARVLLVASVGDRVCEAAAPGSRGSAGPTLTRALLSRLPDIPA